MIRYFNKIQECRQEGITIKELFSYYKKRLLETKEEKKQREINSTH